jgi:hypothetical protein
MFLGGGRKAFCLLGCGGGAVILNYHTYLPRFFMFPRSAYPYIYTGHDPCMNIIYL